MKSFLADRPRVPSPNPLAAPEPVPFSPTEAPAATPRAFTALSSPRPPAAAASAPVSRPGDHASTVECIREGDRITRLVVTCACGERTEIDCLYSAGS